MSQSPDRATTKMKRPRSSVAAVSVYPVPPPISPRTIAPRMGSPVSSRTTPAMRLVWAFAAPLEHSTNAAANTERKGLDMEEVYQLGNWGTREAVRSVPPLGGL